MTVFTASDIVHRYCYRLVSWLRWNGCSVARQLSTDQRSMRCISYWQYKQPLGTTAINASRCVKCDLLSFLVPVCKNQVVTLCLFNSADFPVSVRRMKYAVGPQTVHKTTDAWEISGFGRNADEIYALLGCCEGWSGNLFTDVSGHPIGSIFYNYEDVV